MQPEQEKIAKRAVACKGWRWMSGMRWRTEDDRGRLDDYQPEYMGRPPDALPDLTDPATLGCLLALVRKAHAVPVLQVSVKISPEHGYKFDCHPHHRGQWVDSEAEALVAALEDAP